MLRVCMVSNCYKIEELKQSRVGVIYMNFDLHVKGSTFQHNFLTYFTGISSRHEQTEEGVSSLLPLRYHVLTVVKIWKHLLLSLSEDCRDQNRCTSSPSWQNAPCHAHGHEVAQTERLTSSRLLLQQRGSARPNSSQSSGGLGGLFFDLFYFSV